jgi:hemoglobin/transferrin/lactoferrin receptor protein
MTRHVVAFGIAGALVAGQALAQARDPAGTIQLDELVVSGGGRGAITPIGPRPPQPTIPVQPGQSVSVIDRAEIERRNPSSILDLLRDVPGVTISQTGGIGGTAFVRGLNTNDFRVPVFVDGDRFRGRNTLQLSYFSPDDIERIEVIRGPVSSMYGSDALGGLINIVTRRAPRGDRNAPFRFTGGESFVQYGSNGEGRQASTSIEGSGAGFDLRFGVNARKSDDYFTRLGRIGNSDYETFSPSFVLGYSPDDSQRLEASFRSSSVSDGNAGGVPAFPAVASRRATNQVTSGRIAYKGEFANGPFRKIEASLYRNEFYTKITTLNRNNPLVITDSSSYVLGPTVWGGRFAAELPGDRLKTTIGADFATENRPGSEALSFTTRRTAAGAITGLTIAPRAKTGPEATQTDIGAFIHSRYEITPALIVSGAGRVDWITSTVALAPLPSPALLPAFQQARNLDEVAPTGSVGLVYKPFEMLELVANAGTSFRTPTAFDLYAVGFTGTTYTIPNPGLEPEKGVNVEAGFRLLLPSATISATVFKSWFENFILAVPTTFAGLPATQRQNVGEVEISGVETELRWQATESLNLFGSAAALRATNTTTNRPVPYIAPFSGRVGFQYALPVQGVSLNGTLNFAAGKSRIDPAQEFKTSPYMLANVFAELKLDTLISPMLGNTTMTLGVTNIFDTKYRSAATLANTSFREGNTNPLIGPGRSFTVALRTRW